MKYNVIYTVPTSMHCGDVRWITLGDVTRSLPGVDGLANPRDDTPFLKLLVLRTPTSSVIVI